MNLRRANENNFYAVYFRSLINLEINAAFYYITRLVGRIIQINIEFWNCDHSAPFSQK